ncbi:MAG: protein kinase [Planctomycetes bacterium]|nr:protein kinase [Planctomycetota bacterium]
MKEQPAAGISDRESRLQKTYSEYLLAAQSDRAAARREFLARYPDLAADLVEIFEGEDCVRQFTDSSTRSSPREAGRGAAPLEPPRPFGDYELLELIGRGGMGLIYRARQKSLSREVALKMILAGHLASGLEVERCRLEAKAAARLDHPNIVPIYEVGELEGQHFFTMKLIDGGNLADEVRRFTADPGAAARLLEKVARAVHYANENGILHRDLKPGNILLDRSGEPYITDFGLAKEMHGEARLTLSHAILGTPAYMAPELAAGKKRRHPITALVDIYSLGAILYDLLTGQPPFKSDSSIDMLRQVVEEEPMPPSKVQPKAPRDLETICLKCLEKEPKRRYASALALAEELRRYLDGKPIEARPATFWERGFKWARRRPAIAALLVMSAVAVLSLLGVGISYYRSSRFSQEVERRNALDLLTRQVVSRHKQYAAQVNAAYEAFEKGLFEAALMALEEARSISGEKDLLSFEWYCLWHQLHQDHAILYGHLVEVLGTAFSADRKTLASTGVDGTVWLWDTVTGIQKATLEGHGRPVLAAVFSPDGKILASAGEDNRIWLWDTESGIEKWVLSGHQSAPQAMAFSLDGALLYSVDGQGFLKVWDLASWQERDSFSVHGGAVSVAAFSRHGERLAVIGSGEAAVKIWDVAGGKAVAVLKDPVQPIADWALAISPDGALVATSNQEHALKLWDVETGKAVAALPGHRRKIRSLAFSDDGKALATSGVEGFIKLWEAGNWNDKLTLSGHAIKVGTLAFSPDGKRLASGSFDGTVRLWNLPTIQKPVRFSGSQGPVLWAAFTPDSRFLATGGGLITGEGDFKFLLWDIDSWNQAGEAVVRGSLRLEAKKYTWAALSRDGRWLAAAGRDQKVKLWRLAADQAGLQSAPAGSLEAPNGEVVALLFSAGGDALAAAGREGEVRLWVKNSGPQGERWTLKNSGTTPLRKISDLAISPDLRLLALAGQRQPEVLLWDLERGREAARLRGHSKWAVALAFSADSKLLATGGLDRTIKLWSLSEEGESRGAELKQTLEGHANAVAALSFSLDGKILISNSDDLTLKIWDLVTGEARATLRGPKQLAITLALSLDGRYLASGGGSDDDSEILLFRAASREDVEGRAKSP